MTEKTAAQLNAEVAAIQKKWAAIWNAEKIRPAQGAPLTHDALKKFKQVQFDVPSIIDRGIIGVLAYNKKAHGDDYVDRIMRELAKNLGSYPKDFQDVLEKHYDISSPAAKRESLLKLHQMCKLALECRQNALKIIENDQKLSEQYVNNYLLKFPINEKTVDVVFKKMLFYIQQEYERSPTGILKIQWDLIYKQDFTKAKDRNAVMDILKGDFQSNPKLVHLVTVMNNFNLAFEKKMMDSKTITGRAVAAVDNLVNPIEIKSPAQKAVRTMFRLFDGAAAKAKEAKEAKKGLEKRIMPYHNKK